MMGMALLGAFWLGVAWGEWRTERWFDQQKDQRMVMDGWEKIGPREWRKDT